MLVILLNCVTLGMYQPCVDFECVTNRCKILQMYRYMTLERTWQRYVGLGYRRRELADGYTWYTWWYTTTDYFFDGLWIHYGRVEPKTMEGLMRNPTPPFVSRGFSLHYLLNN
ncbi:hypothetical protein J6590_029005 [Homalodisca vitripennis]|nr:hypothetical protein J6590_029005 [Homalodisca vitripennis]